MDVALVTHAGLPELAPDERPMIPALAQLGIQARPAVWTDPDVAWDEYDAAIVRSTWDYHLRRNEYLEWVDRAARSTRLWNPAPVLRWNSHKSYLRDLEQRGVPIIPTVWSDGSRTLEEVLADQGWENAVFKPVVSAAAHRTHRVSRSSLATAEPLYRALCEEQVVLVQPYLESVERHGEHSLIFLDGVFSHAVDRPAVLAPTREFPGEEPVVAPDSERALGIRALEAVGVPTLYARVDVARDGSGSLCLMELELVEPTLFLQSAPAAGAKFARAIRSHLP
ncbi:MAG: hypothetical protein L3J92_06645 [Thermoplasmata archaeon]|jgi:glutathione synthase/RimK-type ligase-like ATP-grasp enzyme|nr:hypothetical protein [Thermoplasmata archaeon]